jgi:N-6 DNA Methylase
MASTQFKQALTTTGYIESNGKDAPGLVRSARGESARLRPVLLDSRIGLNADAVFSVQGTPTAIFKDAGAKAPSNLEIQKWHEAAWNLGVAPLLWIITPTEIRLYDCYSSPPRDGGSAGTTPLESFALDNLERLRSLDAMCGRLATETGAFWSSEIGKRIDRRFRVDRELLTEISALEERLTDLPPARTLNLRPHDEATASRDFAQRLIGRCIFTWYLLDRGLAEQFLPKHLPADLSKLFKTTSVAFSLFAWLRQTFNGDLFPMDNPGAEHKRLSSAHLALIRDFAEGRSLNPKSLGQGRLFRFRFDAIPVDLVSSIYQQFARSSAQNDAHLQGLHYTPVEIVHLTLDPVFEQLPKTARIIDPACGSGAFLVEAFRRLVWRKSAGKPVKRATVRSILYNQLFGIDINRSALGIAAFSLYLAALEFDEEPVENVADLKFDRLIGATLFQADTVNDELPKRLTDKFFDVVVGNPPWTFDSRNTAQPRKVGGKEFARPRRSPDQAFLNVGAKLAGPNGRIGMVMKATPFFSRDEHAVASRNSLLKQLQPVALINMSALRKEELFPDATGPALLFFARCVLTSQADRILVGSLPWSPDFRRNGVFHVGSGEMRTVPFKRIIGTPAVLKATTFGTVRDGWLIEKLENSFPTLGEILTRAETSPTERGQGFQVDGDENVPPTDYYDLKVVTPDNYKPFRLEYGNLDRFRHKTLHRCREREIFRGPIVLCPKASFKAAAQRGRYGATVALSDVLYTESFYGISFATQCKNVAFALSAILNSSLTTFQLAFGGGAWGLERSTVEPKDLLSIRVPDIFGKSSETKNIVEAEANAATSGANIESLSALDKAVFDFYDLEADETVLADDSIERARMLIFEGRGERQRFVKPPAFDALEAYATQAVGVVDRYLRAKGERHLEATVYSQPLMRASWEEGSPGLTAVRFSMAAGKANGAPVVHRGGSPELGNIEILLKEKLQSNIAPYVNERRLLRVYLEKDLFVLKPSELRYWSRTSGLNDADVILGDHWLGDRHAFG